MKRKSRKIFNFSQHTMNDKQINCEQVYRYRSIRENARTAGRGGKAHQQNSRVHGMQWDWSSNGAAATVRLVHTCTTWPPWELIAFVLFRVTHHQIYTKSGSRSPLCAFLVTVFFLFVWALWSKSAASICNSYLGSWKKRLRFCNGQ